MIPLTEKQRIGFSKNNQTDANNASISSLLRVWRPEPKIVSEKVLDIFSYENLTGTDAYVEVANRSDSMSGSVLYLALTGNDGDSKIYMSRNDYDISALKWQHVATVNGANPCIVANTVIRRNKFGEPKLYSNGAPYVFTVWKGILVRTSVGGSRIPMASPGVTDCCAVRAIGDNFETNDPGMFVFYIQANRVYYRHRVNDSWGASTEVDTSFDSAAVWSDISCSFTEDHRIVLSLTKEGTDDTRHSPYLLWSQKMEDLSSTLSFDVQHDIDFGYTGGKITSVATLAVKKPKDEADYTKGSQWIYFCEGDFYPIEGPFIGHRDGDMTAISVRNYTSVHASYYDGTMHCAAIVDGSFTYIRYVAYEDVSDRIMSWKVSRNTGTSINALDVDLVNVGYRYYESDACIFVPGSRLRLQIKVGDSEPLPMITTWIDELSLSCDSDTVSISSRNSIGFILKDQTTNFSYSATKKTYAQAIDAILSGLDAPEFEYKLVGFMPVVTIDVQYGPADTYLGAIESVNDKMPLIPPEPDKFMVFEDAEGIVYIGSESGIKPLAPNGYYVFEENDITYTKKITKSRDGAYSGIRLSGKTSAGSEIQAYQPAETYDGWYVGSNRILHSDWKFPITVDGLSNLAARISENIQNGGIGREFKTVFIPEMLPGDIACRTKNGEIEPLGIITQVDLSFGRNDGYQTGFYANSGGTYILNEDGSVYYRTENIDGFNQKTTLTDLIRFNAKLTKV